MAERLRTTLERWPWLVAASGNDILGYAYGSQHRTREAYRWAVDVSVYVRPGEQRRGIGQALYTPLLTILRLQNYVQACGGIALPNPASVGLHERMGFEPVGVYRKIGFKLGRWHDVGWWQLTLAEPATPPAEPVPFAELMRTPSMREAVGRLLG